MNDSADTPAAKTPKGFIGPGVTIHGSVHSQEEVYLDGDLEGEVVVRGHRVTVGPHGRVRADVTAREVVVLGALKGDVEASERLEVRRDGQVVGRVKTARIQIDEGATIQGGVQITGAEATLVADAPPELR